MRRFCLHHALMQVRWRHRTAYLRKEDQAHWATIRVENVRIGGKMTERYVAHLAGIVERYYRARGAMWILGKGHSSARPTEQPLLGCGSQAYRGTKGKGAVSDAAAIRSIACPGRAPTRIGSRDTRGRELAAMMVVKANSSSSEEKGYYRNDTAARNVKSCEPAPSRR